jgi:hypothetical protein
VLSSTTHPNLSSSRRLFPSGSRKDRRGLNNPTQRELGLYPTLGCYP